MSEFKFTKRTEMHGSIEWNVHDGDEWLGTVERNQDGWVAWTHTVQIPTHPTVLMGGFSTRGNAALALRMVRNAWQAAIPGTLEKERAVAARFNGGKS